MSTEVGSQPRRVLATYRGTGLPRAVRALGLTSFLQDVASEMVYPLLPGFLATLGGGPLVLGAMESTAEGVLALLKGAAGRWSDRLGRRKPFISAGYGLSALARPLMAIAAAPAQVVAIRALDRVAKGLRTAPRDAVIAEVTSAESRGFAFSFHRGLDHLGAATGPLVAALILALAPARLRLVFALATVPATLGWLTVQLTCPETRPDGQSGGGRAAGARLVIPRRLRLPLLAFFLFSLGNASDAFLLLRAAELGIGPAGLTLLWSAFHVAKWLSSAPAGRLADRLGPRFMILAGWLLYGVVYLGFAAVSSAWLLVALFAVYAAYYGLTEGAERLLTVRLANDVGAGTSLGALHFATGLGGFAASLLCGWIWEAYSPAAAFRTGAVLAMAGAALLCLPGVGRAAGPDSSGAALEA